MPAKDKSEKADNTKEVKPKETKSKTKKVGSEVKKAEKKTKKAKPKKDVTIAQPKPNEVLPKYIRRIVATEKSVNLIEFRNTLVFEVEMFATKQDIKDEVEKLYNVKVVDVKTLITPKNVKRAFVKLSPDYHADEIAAKLKVI